MSNDTVLKNALNELGGDGDIEEVTKYLQPDHPSATTLLVGSTNEGFGNSASDIDILIVYPKDIYIQGWSSSKQGTTHEVDPLAKGGTAVRRHQELLILSPIKSAKLQISIIGEELILWIQNQISERLASTKSRINGAPPQRTRRGTTLTNDDLKILHRLYSGTVIHNESAANRFKLKLSESDFRDYLLALRAQEVIGEASDLVGFIKQHPATDHADTQVYLAQRLLLTAASLLTAAVGELNVGEKFIFRLVDRHSEAIEESLAERIRIIYPNFFAAKSLDLRGLLALVDDIIDRAAAISSFLNSDLISRKYKPLTQELDSI